MRELDYQVARSAWIGDYADPNTFLEIWRTGDENNRTGWSDPTFDQLVNQAMAQAPQERLVTLRRAEEILLEQMPVVPVYTYAQFHLVSERVRGWELNAREVHLLRRIRLEGP
jgi:oligopeptide transport system substrate-binding protein